MAGGADPTFVGSDWLRGWILPLYGHGEAVSCCKILGDDLKLGMVNMEIVLGRG